MAALVAPMILLAREAGLQPDGRAAGRCPAQKLANLGLSAPVPTDGSRPLGGAQNRAGQKKSKQMEATFPGQGHPCNIADFQEEDLEDELNRLLDADARIQEKKTAKKRRRQPRLLLWHLWPRLRVPELDLQRIQSSPP